MSMQKHCWRPSGNLSPQEKDRPSTIAARPSRGKNLPPFRITVLLGLVNFSRGCGNPVIPLFSVGLQKQALASRRELL